MKKTLALSLLLSLLAQSGQSQIKINIGQYSSNIENFKDSTIKALKIASFILSTQEFRDSIMHFQFRCPNIPKAKRGICNDSFKGQRVYDSLLKYPDTTLSIVIKKLPWRKRIFDPHDQIGYSEEGNFIVTTRSWYLLNATKNWPPSIKYATHLAHEYCHIRGYHHIKGQQYGADVAQTVGSLVAKIIKRRLENGEPIL